MKWSDIFYVQEVGSNWHPGMYMPPKYEVREKNTNELLGSYEDRRYAIKQARYKFRQRLKKMEKILLG